MLFFICRQGCFLDRNRIIFPKHKKHNNIKHNAVKLSKPMITGKMPLPLPPVIAILSLSLVVNLPGLAVTPMLATLKDVFPDVSPLETQLLTTLPNFLIIPFVLMSGKLSETPRKIRLVTAALIIFALSAGAYLFSKTMLALILFSCSLGIGAGLLIPFSTGLLSDTFAGKPLMKMMGLQSGISNCTLVCATFAVGWLGRSSDWRLPFVVYLVCLIPLALTPLLKRIPKEEIDPELSDKQPATTKTSAPLSYTCNAKGINNYRLWTTFFAYFLLTYCTMAISEYTPFLLSARHLNSSIAGSITSLFFLFVFLPGFFLARVVKVMKKSTFIICGALVLIGMTLFTFIPSIWVMGAGTIIAGFGYGTMQPLLYDKATKTVCRPSLSTRALAIVLVANYTAIAVEPFITTSLGKIFHQSPESIFPFIVSVVLSAGFFVWILAFRNKFCFTVDPENLQ